MDLNKLRTVVFEKTGIRIDTNDPVFALVALNEAVLSECVERHIAELQSAGELLSQETAQLLAAGDRAKKLLLQMGQTVDDPQVAPALRKVQRPPDPVKQSGAPWPWIGAMIGTSLLSCVVVLSLQAAFGFAHAPSPITASPPPATPVVQQQSLPAPALTPEQAQLIQNGEKYAKMWSKLDPKTQARIQQLSQ